ncbi:MAG: MBL fold metallo-hydrolase [Caldilineaceae bacterium]|nr:MBL fold metallo-hydrolase [Caldilineaceae bacterium]
MKIKFYAHASFRLEGDGVAVVTDPYTPGPDVSNFDPIQEPADLVIMSSATDRFHSDPSHVLGNPVVVNAVEVVSQAGKGANQITVKGVPIQAFPSMESLTWEYGRDPEDNAMYLFELEGIRFLHIGDIGNALSEEQLAALAGQVDVMFALAGGNATIALDDLDAAIQAIRPRVIIPMHYFHPKGRLKILPVTEFIDRYPAEMVTFVKGSELEFTPSTLPAAQHIYVLEQSR